MSLPAAESKAQAGGGTSQAADPHNTSIASFEPSVLGVLRQYYDQFRDGKVKLPEDQSKLAKGDFASFLTNISSPSANALLPAPSANFDLPLSSYFISSSHNTYLIGHQLYGQSSVEGYKNVLLRGCRCVEIDCWNGDTDDKTPNTVPADRTSQNLTQATSRQAEPVVLHGYTATREVTFRRVCETIRDHAFSSTDLPLIVSLEVHTNHDQQQMMVDIMNECFKDSLCKPINDDDSGPDTALPSPNKLRNKILIKVKYTPPEKVGALATDAAEPITRTDTSSSSDEEAEPAKDKQKRSKIIEALSQLGLYTRSFHFSALTQPEARVPTHIFSLSESSLMGLYKDDPEGLFNHNKNYMMRTYPKGTRISSSNLNPSIFWRLGVQMVALNWQRIDKGMMLQEAMFQATGGWAPKPDSYLSTAKYEQSQAHLVKHQKSWLKIKVLAAQNIPVPQDVDAEDKMRPYVKCQVHVDYPEQANDQKRLGKNSGSKSKFKLKTSPAKGRHPQFGDDKPLQFDGLPPLVPQLSFVRFKIIHNDRFGRDDFAAWACIRLDRLAPGLRFIRLWDATGAPSDGVLIAMIEFEWNVS